MQVQIKRQLKIELDQADITAAVKQFLADAGHHISDEDLAKVNYVKSPKDGLRAELSISDEVVADEITTPASAQETAVESAKEHIAEVGLAVVEPREEPVAQEDGEQEPAGEVATSTVEDVAPAVNEAVERALAPAETTNEEEGEVPPTERKSLFL